MSIISANAGSTAVAKTPPPSLAKIIIDMKPQIQAALPKHVNVDRIARIALTAIRNNFKLANCNQESFLGSLMVASQLGLEPNTPLGHCYLIPYGNECQFQLGYKGLLDLAFRTGLYSVIYAVEVYEGDEFTYSLGLDKTLNHVPKRGPKSGQPIAYYAVYRLKDGTRDFALMWREDVEAHARKYSKGFNNGPWKTNFDAMAKKTVLIQALKYAPKSIEVAEAIGHENANVRVDMAALKAGELVLDASFDQSAEAEKAAEQLENFSESDQGKLLL